MPVNSYMRMRHWKAAVIGGNRNCCSPDPRQYCRFRQVETSSGKADINDGTRNSNGCRG